MTLDVLAALVVFSFVSSITPGPNNLMLMASGANFGVRRTLPHIAGVGLGFVFLTLVVGAGLGGLFDRFPASYAALKAVSVVYMLWLAWKIAHAAAPGAPEATGRPLTFLQAAAFQWVNPKAWAMALTALALYTPADGYGAVMIVALVFGAVNLPSVGVWVLMGMELRRWLSSPRRLRAFNVTMALLLIASLIPILLG